jgi:hypothetical protein
LPEKKWLTDGLAPWLMAIEKGIADRDGPQLDPRQCEDR